MSKKAPMFILIGALIGFIGFLFVLNSMERDLQQYMIEQGLAEAPDGEGAVSQEGEKESKKPNTPDDAPPAFREDKTYIM